MKLLLEEFQFEKNVTEKLMEHGILCHAPISMLS